MFYGLCFLTVDLILTGALAVVATPAALKGRDFLLPPMTQLISNVAPRYLRSHSDILLGL
jgi:hypothetical protein